MDKLAQQNTVSIMEIKINCDGGPASLMFVRYRYSYRIDAHAGLAKWINAVAFCISKDKSRESISQLFASLMNFHN